MRLRSTAESATDGTRLSDDTGGRAGSDTGAGRKLLLLVIGLAAVAYAVSRYAGRDESVPSLEAVRERAPAPAELREQAPAVVSEGFEEIPIGGRDEGPSAADEAGDVADHAASVADDVADEANEAAGDASADATDVATDVIENGETSVDLTDEIRSPDEIAERAAEDVPEPGEMAVDEGVADELVDEDRVAEDESDTEDERGTGKTADEEFGESTDEEGDHGDREEAGE